MSDLDIARSNSFGFLRPFWPELHGLASKAEQAAQQEPDLTAIKLRSFTETMVVELFAHLGLPSNPGDKHFDRLLQLENADLLDARLLAKFHTIRKLGNNVAHGKGASSEQVEGLLEDAWSLAGWFCRFMKPDVEWLIPTRAGLSTTQGAPYREDDHSRQPTGSAKPSNVLKFPDDRIRRIREDVAKAMSQVDPRVRRLRTPISLRDAFVEPLSEDQSACLESLENFLQDQTRRIFLLKGYAGTGKTFLARGITEFLAAQGRNFRLAGPTGRAAKVLSEKTERDARTVHSMIYDFGDIREYSDQELGSETYKFYAGIAPNREQANTVYIVDESSLLSNVYSESEFFRSGTGYLLQDLLTYIDFNQGDHDRKIIFIGDGAQLPPVGMATSPALDGEYLCKQFGHRPTEYELTEVLRQKADSAVLRNAMPLRESLSKGAFNSLAFHFDDDVRRIQPDDILPTYLAARGKSQTGLPIVITYSNAEASALNQDIRTALFPGRDFVTAGDLLMVMGNAFVGQHFLANGEFVQVDYVESAVERRSVRLRHRNSKTGMVEDLEVALHFRDVRLVVASDEGENAVVDVKLLDDYLHGAGTIGAAQQRALYVDFLRRHQDLRRDADPKRFAQILRQDTYFNALRAKFGYAVTCHKAQGGEWADVVVSCSTGQNPRTADYYRWLYTAITRSSVRLYLVSPPEVRIPVVGPLSRAGLDPNSDGGSAATPGSTAAADGISPQEAFRQATLAQARELLADTGIELEDVAHHQYQEAFYLRRGDDTARVNVSYNGRFRITAVSSAQVTPFGEQVRELLAPLVGMSGAVPAQQPRQVDPGVPSRPFLKDYHDRILPLFDVRGILMVSLKEQAWNQRYTFSRGTETAVVDVFYDGRNRITSCLPITSARLSSPPGPLLRDVLEILTLGVDA